MGLEIFRRRGGEGRTRLIFATDIHGSLTAYKKLLNAALMYKARYVVIGGDISGKELVPVIDRGDGTYEAEGRIIKRSELGSYISLLRGRGGYYVVVDRQGYEELSADRRKVDEAFRRVLVDMIREWDVIAQEKLAGAGVEIYVNLGNDDPPYLFDALREAVTLRPAEGEVVDMAGREMLSYGYTNPTPWNTPREKDEEEIYADLFNYASKLSRPGDAIFNVHAPPYGTNLDNAPQLTEDLRPVIRGGEIATFHAGSKSVRRIIEEFQPLLGLHGHIHESRGYDRIGRTLVLNPGSEYSAGLLHAAIIVLGDGGVDGFQLIIG